MLTHYKTREEVKPDGSRWMVATDELVDDPCEDCGAESVPNVCAGDGRYHHHGRVHTKDGGLRALCETDATRRAKEWQRTPA